MRGILAQAVRYYCVGAFAMALDFALFRTLLNGPISAVLATAISSPTAAAVHFTLNRFWSFPATCTPLAVLGWRYAIIYTCILLSTVGTVAIGTSTFGMSPMAAKAAAVLVTLPIGFLGHKYVTFGDATDKWLGIWRRPLVGASRAPYNAE